MGIIREPKGIDLIVEPSDLTKKDKKLISKIIANYKKTGKKPSKRNVSKSGRTTYSIFFFLLL